MVLLLLFLEGVLAFISPCILPMVPIYLVYLGGDQTAANESEVKNRIRRRILNTLAFVLGFTLVFVLLGAVATGIGSYLNKHLSSIRIISAVIMILIGIYYLDLIHLPERFRVQVFKNRKQKAETKHEGGVLRSFLFGLAFSTTWLPCVGTFLASALTLAANRSTVFEGMGMLFVFAMGLGLPFLVTSILFERLRGLFGFLKRHARVVRIISGLLLILLGVAMLFDLQGWYMGLFN